MANYFVNTLLGKNTFNAGSKAIQDYAQLLNQMAYHGAHYPFEVGKSKFVKFKNLLNHVADAFCKFKKDSKVIYFYPDILFYPSLFKILSLKKHIKIALICDINTMRNPDAVLDEYGIPKLGEYDRNKLLKFDYIIAHTTAMQQALIRGGIAQQKIKVMHFIDYQAKVENKIKRHNNWEICYAGNLAKSEFLKELPQFYKNEAADAAGEVADAAGVAERTVKFNLYGLIDKNVHTSKNVVYKGKFHPDDLSSLEGAWGLVWDGPHISSCSGSMGDYLKVNIPHKTTLYVAAKMPVIISKQAALAPFIEKHGLGIAVDSLYELPERLSKISEEDYQQIISNLENFKWGYLKKVLDF